MTVAFKNSPRTAGHTSIAPANTSVWAGLSFEGSSEIDADRSAIPARIAMTLRVEGKPTRLMKLKASTVPPTPVLGVLDTKSHLVLVPTAKRTADAPSIEGSLQIISSSSQSIEVLVESL